MGPAGEGVFGGVGEYDWIDLKHFRIDPSTTSGVEALRLLIADVRFRDHYAEATSHEKDSEELHGRYWLRAISAASYTAIDHATAREVITKFAERYSSAERAAARVELVTDRVFPILDHADEFFRLKDLGNEAEHDWGWVLDDFTEIVVIDHERGRLSLVVASED